MQTKDQASQSQTREISAPEAVRSDAMLAELTSGRLAERIAEAARLAWSRHLSCSAESYRSVSEAETSG